MNARNRQFRHSLVASVVGAVVVAACYGDKPPPVDSNVPDGSGNSSGEGSGASSGEGGSDTGSGKAGKGGGGDSGANGEGAQSGDDVGVGGSMAGGSGGMAGSAGGGAGGSAGTAGSAGSGGSGPGMCGNMVEETGEECDDGNLMSGDGCSKTCTSACEECAADSATFVPADCYMLEGIMQEGPGATFPRAELCSAMLECIQDSECAIKVGPPIGTIQEGLELIPCYCTAEDRSLCTEYDLLPEDMSGPCRYQFEEATGATRPTTVLGKIYERLLPAGVAAGLYTKTYYLECRDECTPHLPGEGGTGGMGGMGGSAGMAGTGGGAAGGGTGGSTAGSGAASGSSGAGGTGGSSGSGAGGTAGTGGSGGTEAWVDPTTAACLLCEVQATDCAPLIDLCDTFTTNAERGPAMGRPRRELCREVLDCVRETNCMEVRNTDCYCGIGADPAACLTGDIEASGPCMAEIRGGLETSGTTNVLQRYINETYAGGAALRRVTCDRANCAGDTPPGEAATTVCFAP